MRSNAIGDFVAHLADRTGNPGGGAAGGVVTAISAALSGMVCAYTDDDARASTHADRLRDLAERALDAASADATASAALGSALALAESPDRDDAVVTAAGVAVSSSAALGAIAIDVWQSVMAVSEFGNRHLASDLSVSAGIVAAGIGAALTNLRGGIALVDAHGDATDLDHEHAALVSRLLRARTEARELADRLSAP